MRGLSFLYSQLCFLEMCALQMDSLSYTALPPPMEEVFREGPGACWHHGPGQHVVLLPGFLSILCWVMLVREEEHALAHFCPAVKTRNL